MHRLLGPRRDSRGRFTHHAHNRLPHDVIVLDETSMVSLTMMARLVESVRSDCRLVFVGDADQLASVEAGAVLADLVDGLTRRDPAVVAGLTHRLVLGRPWAERLRHAAALGFAAATAPVAGEFCRADYERALDQVAMARLGTG